MESWGASCCAAPRWRHRCEHAARVCTTVTPAPFQKSQVSIRYQVPLPLFVFAEMAKETMLSKAAARGRALREQDEASPRQRRRARDDGRPSREFAPLDRAYVKLQPAKCDMLSPRLSPRLSVSGWVSPRNTVFQTVAAARQELDRAEADDIARWQMQMQNPTPRSEANSASTGGSNPLLLA